MSWLFALLLGAYVLLWFGLWIQGQMRWRSSDERTRTAPVAEAPPKHLDPLRRELFDAAQQARLSAWAQAHRCRQIMITDPDARLSGVRNGGFRRVSIEGAQQVRAFCEQVRAADELDPGLLTGMPDLISSLDAVQATLDAHADRVRGARALEAFPLAFCRATQRALEHTQQLAELLCDSFARRSFVDPYRPGRESTTTI